MDEQLRHLHAEQRRAEADIDFWERQPPDAVKSLEWMRSHLDGLKRYLEDTKAAIRILQTGDGQGR